MRDRERDRVRDRERDIEAATQQQGLGADGWNNESRRFHSTSAAAASPLHQTSNGLPCEHGPRRGHPWRQAPSGTGGTLEQQEGSAAEAHTPIKDDDSQSQSHAGQ